MQLSERLTALSFLGLNQKQMAKQFPFEVVLLDLGKSTARLFATLTSGAVSFIAFRLFNPLVKVADEVQLANLVLSI